MKKLTLVLIAVGVLLTAMTPSLTATSVLTEPVDAVTAPYDGIDLTPDLPQPAAACGDCAVRRDCPRIPGCATACEDTCCTYYCG